MSPEQRFEAAYQEHYWALVRYFARRVRPERARDLAAEVFTIAWRRRDHMPDQALGWLYAVAGNLARNERRRFARHASLLHRLFLARPEPGADADADADAGDLGGDGEHQWVLTAMGALSPGDREVLRLSAWEELDATQIAVALSTSRSAAAMRLHRAKTRLRAHLESEPASQQILRRSR